MVGRPPVPAYTRLFSRVELHASGCWLWTGSTVPGGYGQIRDSASKMVKTHRLAYELICEPVPNELLVCHACDVPNCVNPLHLWLGTYQDNSDDMVVKGRSVHLSGPANPMFGVTGPAHPRYMVEHTKETRIKIVEALKRRRECILKTL